MHRLLPEPTQTIWPPSTAGAIIALAAPLPPSRLARLTASAAQLHPSGSMRPENTHRLDLTGAELSALVEASFDRVVVFDRDGRYLRVPAGRDRLYRPFDQTIGRRMHEVLPDALASRFLAAVHAALDSGATQHLEYEMEMAGEPTRIAAAVAPTGEGTVVWIARDISEQRRAEEALRASEAGHRELLASLPVIVYWVSPTPPYAPTYVSPGVQALGYTVAEWMAEPDTWLRIIHPDDRDRVLAMTDAALHDRSRIEYEYRVITKSGEERWVHDRGEFLRDTEGSALAWRGVMIDVTERRQLEDRLAALSEEDDLTRLLNRRGFRRMAEQALKVEHRARRAAALLYFDVDGFKAVNDTWGHAAGDRALQRVAAALSSASRDGDLVARLGGDEFVVLALGSGSAGQGERLADRLRNAVREATRGVADERTLHGQSAAVAPAGGAIDVSVGVAEDPGGISLDELLHAADRDLYRRRALARSGANPDREVRNLE